MLLNLPRATAFLDRCRLDGLIACSWQNILYLSDFYVWLQPVFKEYMAQPGSSDDPLSLFAVITKTGNASLVVDHMFELIAASSWASTRYVYGAESEATSPSTTTSKSGGSVRGSPLRFDLPIEALVAALHAEQLADARIGVDTAAMPIHRLAALKSAMPRAEFLDATNLFRLIRMVKSEEELRRLRRAAELNEVAAAEGLAHALPGNCMQQVAQRFQQSVASAGAVFDHFAFSQGGLGIATEGDYELPKQEVMFVDFGCIFQHYYADAGTTLILGDFGERVRTGFRVLVECLHETAARMRPGATASTIQEFMQRFLDSNRLSGQFPHGHGIGVELRDYPILAPSGGRRIRDDCIDVSADLPLEQGMVINLEAPVFDWNGSALQLEQTYVVTANGAEALTGRNLSEPMLAGS